MADLGLFISQQGKNISSSDLDFDSRRRHLLIDLDASPEHVGVISLTGTNITSTGAEVSETLFTIPHGLPYIPKVETYFFVSGSFNLYAGAGSYYRGFFPYSGSTGTYFDRIVGEVDDTNFYIRHKIVALLGPTFTSDAASYPLQVKYLIFSNHGDY